MWPFKRAELDRREKDLEFKQECWEIEKAMYSRNLLAKIDENKAKQESEIEKIKAQTEYDAYHWYHTECEKMVTKYTALVEKFVGLMPQLKGEVQIIESINNRIIESINNREKGK